jgi:hypothetical protein
VAIRGDCKRIVSRGNDGTVRFWDAESDLEKLALKESARRVTSVAISSDGEGDRLERLRRSGQSPGCKE